MQNEHTFMKKLHNNIVTGIKTFPELTYKYTAKQKTPLQSLLLHRPHLHLVRQDWRKVQVGFGKGGGVGGVGTGGVGG